MPEKQPADNFLIQEEFNDTFMKFAIDDSVHADIVNPLLQNLLDNTNWLKKNVNMIDGGVW